MEKIASPCESGFCFHWWPKLPLVEGWHHDPDNSMNFSFNAQAPDGKTFGDAETVIYANAPYKPRIPEVKSLQQFIENDRQDFTQSDPKIKIEEVEPLVTADGQKLRSYVFSPSGPGNWEQVSYGEEGEFYLVFVLSSKTKLGLFKARADYEKFITRYKSNP